MNGKTTISVFLMLMLSISVSRGQNAGKSATEVILSSYSAKMFTSEPVSDQNLDLILKCGIKAPSARNNQLWKFTVVRDTAIIGRIVRNYVPGNVLIIVSGSESAQQSSSVDFDCGLATENMYVAAQSLGLGAHIYTGPVGNINSTMKQILEIPEGYRVVDVLRIGSIDRNVDAVTAASARKKMEEVVIYKK
jgi:nitroreductase